MEQNEEKSLFEMNMDSTTQSHLLSISKWTKFISVTGFIIAGLVLLLLVAYGAEIIKQFSVLFSFGNGDLAGAFIAIVLVVMLIFGFWLYFLFRASTLLKKGLQNRDTAQLADGFKAMRIYFVFSFVISTLSILSTLRTLI
jgi:hypothetical protein